ncbi:MAG: hypothetical protein R3C44_09350 [Chloroflexota bacterium]
MLTAITSLVVIALCVYVLTILTDEYFIPSLDEISKRANIPSNVAGASLMAMGSSMPELTIALIALFLSVVNIAISALVTSSARPYLTSWSLPASRPLSGRQ